MFTHSIQLMPVRFRTGVGGESPSRGVCLAESDSILTNSNQVGEVWTPEKLRAVPQRHTGSASFLRSSFLRSFSSRSFLRRRIDFGVTSTSSSSSI